MDKDIISTNHSVSITERKNIMITGVKKIDNFDKLHFILETTMGFMVIKGEGLELIKLDTLAGNVTITGGVTIGSGSVIGANSVVTSDIPSNHLYGGVPAKYIKKL